jgi:hypothetical protein
MRGGYLARELNIASQVELVRNVIQITLGLRLPDEVFLSVPPFQRFLKRARATDAGAGLERTHPEPKFTER